jgi:hypothetical protein
LTGIYTYILSCDRSLSLSFLSVSIIFTSMSRLPILSFCVLSFLYHNEANILLWLMIILHNIIQMMWRTTEHDTQANAYECTHMQRGSCHRTISSGKKKKKKLTHLEKGNNDFFSCGKEYSKIQTPNWTTSHLYTIISYEGLSSINQTISCIWIYAYIRIRAERIQSAY